MDKITILGVGGQNAVLCQGEAALNFWLKFDTWPTGWWHAELRHLAGSHSHTSDTGDA